MSPSEEHCTFCALASSLPIQDPSFPSPSPSSTSTAHYILSTPNVIAFLDILPLTRCHVLVCPRAHREKLTDLSPSESAAVGAWLPLVARAACNVSGVSDFNVVQNNGANASQVVPHAHYHIIPRPDERQRSQIEAETPQEQRLYWRSPFGAGWRTELDDDEGERLAELMREELRRGVEEFSVGGVGGKVLACL